jgi:putative ABC transport system substrate-binding protein
VNRREFAAAALATACIPPAAFAQPAGRLYRVGWLDLSSSAENLGVFAQAMGARGWVDGKSFRIDYRGGEGKADRLAAVAAELARVPADVIVAPGSAEAQAARRATGSIPIVMSAVDDPVDLGLVASLARPGGNVTGLASARKEQSGKLLSLLREVVPRATSVAVLWDSTDPDHRVILGYVQGAARTVGLAVTSVPVARPAEIEPAIAGARKQGAQMLIVFPSSMLVQGHVADLALKQGLPLASTAPGYAYEGGLIAFSDDWNAVYERVATYVDRILKGAKPADLPVELPSKFKLIVNTNTAKRLGIAIAPSLLLRADHVIE